MRQNCGTGSKDVCDPTWPTFGQRDPGVADPRKPQGLHARKPGSTWRGIPIASQGTHLTRDRTKQITDVVVAIEEPTGIGAIEKSFANSQEIG